MICRKLELFFCKYCGVTLHYKEEYRSEECNKKDCKGKSEDCKCHAVNEQIWKQKKGQSEQNS
jgi:hypothetical protein